MSCVSVATSPTLAACHLPCIRHCDEATTSSMLLGGVDNINRSSPSSSNLDHLHLMPSSSSPLHSSTTPKLSPLLISKQKPNNNASSTPQLSPIALPSPAVLCSPKTPSSWTSPINTPTTNRSSCLCGGFSICSSCSCTLASGPSSGEVRWSCFPKKRENNINISNNPHVDSGVMKCNGASNSLFSSRLDGLSPRVSNANSALNSSNSVSFGNRSGSPSPTPRYFSSSTARLHTVVEAPSPRFGAGNFMSPRPLLPRVNSNHGLKNHITASDESGNKENAGCGNLGSWRLGAKALFRLDIPKDQEESNTEPHALQLNAGLVREAITAGGEKVLPGHSGGPCTPPLKRKRPPKLEIPLDVNLVRNMMPHGVDLNEDAMREMTVEGSYYGISCKKGRREQLEDTQRAIPDLHGDPGQAFFGVFDGHGGRKAADYAAENLVHNIIEAMESSDRSQGYMEESVRKGYLTTDAEFLKKGVSSGASCVTVMMKDGYMVVANAGDCRAVLSRAGHAEALTSDHRAGREDERNRIEKLGGYVDNLTGTWRVQGVLAVTRGIGDLELKEWISAEPEVQMLKITPDCEFVILASDGLWDAVSNQEAVDFARVILQEASTKAAVSSAGERVSSTKAGGNEGGLDICSPLYGGESWSNNGLKASAPEEGDIDIRAGSLDTGVLDTGIPETPAPAAGPVAACRKLLELSVERRCHDDDISVMIVDLRHFCKSSD